VKLLFATRNRGKLRELHELLALPGVELFSLDDRPDVPELEEKGETFAENAASKAQAAARATSMIALADDSGLEVDALGGEPGVRSARYAGPGASDADRIQLLLRKLAEVPAGQRSARFRCVVALCDPARPDDVELRQGSCEGEILFSPRGSGGFGYDPVFLSRELGQTFAEAPADAKNQVSHRGRAMQQMAELIRARARGVS
jgi:XTP/dITP diphosphohydrolase